MYWLRKTIIIILAHKYEVIACIIHFRYWNLYFELNAFSITSDEANAIY